MNSVSRRAAFPRRNPRCVSGVLFLAGSFLKRSLLRRSGMSSPARESHRLAAGIVDASRSCDWGPDVTGKYNRKSVSQCSSGSPRRVAGAPFNETDTAQAEAIVVAEHPSSESAMASRVLNAERKRSRNLDSLPRGPGDTGHLTTPSNRRDEQPYGPRGGGGGSRRVGPRIRFDALQRM